MKSIVISPHPDDEVLGAGGTLLKRKRAGHKIAWLIVSSISTEHGWKKKQIERREKEIKKISKFFNRTNTLLKVIRLNLVHNEKIFRGFFA